MFIALAILLSAVALFAVAYPVVFRSGPARPTVSSAQESLDELLAHREAAFQALRELNFDHRVGKITDEDFVAFEAHLKQVAADALRALDAWEAAADDKLARTVRQRHAAGRACPACGAPAKPDDKFCAGCGATLSESAAESATAGSAQPGAVCPTCALPYQAGDRFCAGCGAALAV